MLVLGIESTAHTFGIGIYDSNSGRILSNEKAYFKPINEGIVPRKAADFHAKNGARVLEQSLSSAGVRISEIDVFSYSRGPGLGPCLKTGATMASFLAQMNSKPLVPVNHCHAHIEISRWQLGMKNPLCLYVSGGNTQIVGGSLNSGVFGPPFTVFGETLDIGVGNLFDAFARELGEEFAHGSVIAKKAQKAKRYIVLPYTVKGMNFAFSGLLTNAKKLIPKANENDLCFSLMETAFAELCEATERALLMSGKKELLACGGVAQNKTLCSKLGKMASPHKVKFGVAKSQFNADNGAMIAQTGYVQFIRGKRISPENPSIEQKWRIDSLE